MTINELRNICKLSEDEILKYIINNPDDRYDLLKNLKTIDKDKWFNVSSLLKDTVNPNGEGASKVKEIRDLVKDGFEEIKISLLIENPFQPRIEMDKENIIELANSIKKDGLLSPITVSPNKNGTFTIVFGHRRVEAHKHLGLEKIKCIIEENDSVKLRRKALIENLQREDLSPIEKALSYKDAMKEEGLETQRELSNELGINEARISETLSILRLNDEIIKDLHANKKIRDVAALSLLNKFPSDKQLELYELLKNGEIDREGLRSLLIIKPKQKTSQCETQIKSNKLQLVFRSKIVNKKDLKSFQEEVKRLTDEFVEKLKEKENSFLLK